MSEIAIVIRLILVPSFLAIVFACLALGMGGDVFDRGDRLYFGFASGVALVICAIGVWLFRSARKKAEKMSVKDREESVEAPR